jgi:hypothetical protein
VSHEPHVKLRWVSSTKQIPPVSPVRNSRFMHSTGLLKSVFYAVWLTCVDRRIPCVRPAVGTGVTNRNGQTGKIVAISRQNRVWIGNPFFLNYFSSKPQQTP